MAQLSLVNASVLAPKLWQPSNLWSGNDGSWNTFIVQAGTPPQGFQVLPSTAGHELWVPLPDGCAAIAPSAPGYCGYLRGALPFDGVNSSGFASNESSTWNAVGLYTLDAQEAQLGYGGNGLYGLDTVVWGNSSSSPKLTQQVVAGVADPDFWLGVAGLAPKPSNFSDFDYPITSYLGNLVNNSLIPSLTWAYTAGASYRSQAPASLTLGGYDTNRFEGPGLSMTMDADVSRPLQVGVKSILGTNTLNNAVNLLPTATYHFVDSTLPHIWLPDDSIDQFVSSFGLTYDNNTDLFLINDTMRAKILSLNPSVTFILTSDLTDGSSSTQNIELPYAAFDLQASYPFYENATNYFPIRRAANSTQYTIGRTLLQEAYLIADFDRNNFTIAQASFGNLDVSNIVAILPPAAANATKGTSTGTEASHSIGSAAIAGIAIGAGAVLACFAATVWIVHIRRKRRTLAAAQQQPNRANYQDLYNAGTGSGTLYEVAGHERLEMPERSRDPTELDSAAKYAEMDEGGSKWPRYGVQELSASVVGHESGILSEAPGSEGFRYELSADGGDQEK